MKRTIIYCFIIVLGSIAFLSCKKKKKEPEVPTASPECRISSMKINGSEKRLTYDNNNYLIRLEDTEPSGTHFVTDFTYSASQIIQKEYNSNNILSKTITYARRADGLAVNAVVTDDGFIDSTFYTYNADNCLIQLKRKYYTKQNGAFKLYYTQTQDHTISGGNRTRTLESMKGTPSDYEREMTYQYDLTRSGYTGLNTDLPFLGKRSASLLNMMTTSQGGPRTEHQYEFGSDGKPTVMKMRTITGQIVVDERTFQLAYACQ